QGEDAERRVGIGALSEAEVIVGAILQASRPTVNIVFVSLTAAPALYGGKPPTITQMWPPVQETPSSVPFWSES
ncbi:MAG: hypothetical protein ACLQVK_07025, partial [Acidimicrobiales bacterium]